MAKVWVFALVYNEATLAPYFVRHYLSFCDKVILYVDVDTTDGTAEIAQAEGADVRPWDGHGIGLDDLTFVRFANENYHEATDHADWVIWADADEWLYHPRLPERLDELTAENVTIPTIDAYVMSSPSPPTHPGQIYDDPNFQRGIFIQRNAKLMCFAPKLVSVNWGPGKHNTSISGTVREDDGSDPLMMLHYRWLGEEYLLARDARNYARMSADNKAHAYGIHVHPGFHGPYTKEWTSPGPESASQIIFPTSRASASDRSQPQAASLETERTF